MPFDLFGERSAFGSSRRSDAKVSKCPDVEDSKAHYCCCTVMSPPMHVQPTSLGGTYVVARTDIDLRAWVEAALAGVVTGDVANSTQC